MKIPNARRHPAAYVPADAPAPAPPSEPVSVDAAAEGEWTVEEPQAFGSWSCSGARLRLFYGMPHNGERFRGARIVEEGREQVVIALSRVAPAGPRPLVGGYGPAQVEVELARPLDGRRVVDASTGAVRPSAASF